ncbi:unnamed protein product [Zymoseptoria tritici ST99CH_3D7]|uniref:Major facilitator superfamily (MFS) profile domain-containing protein n=1 Tax=Zymoseptoria tritici (strain ST99CH_3D7) TaxID=1276538 RepID=A0A1X7RDC4_ZYMT9|nr:unnamed protein product [Zymoseptoria tritici ST99CH_3D7]
MESLWRLSSFTTSSSSASRSWLLDSLYPSEINSNRARKYRRRDGDDDEYGFVFILLCRSRRLVSRISATRFYVIFAVSNAFWLPFIYIFYPETRSLSLDEIDRVFELKFAPGAKWTYEQATVLAKEAVVDERREIARQERRGDVKGEDGVRRIEKACLSSQCEGGVSEGGVE